MEDVYPTRGDSALLLRRQDPVVYGATGYDVALEQHADLERFERDGYLQIPELFFEAETAAALKEAEQLRDRASQDRPPEAFFEPGGDALRSIFAVHRSSAVFEQICRDSRVLDLVRVILGDEVYVHQSRLNYKPPFNGREFYWHSDFETWHAEDGMPRMRAVSLSLSLTPSLTINGPLMIMPGSHQTFASCPGDTPHNHYRQSLVRQQIGTPDERTLKRLSTRGVKAPTGSPGSAVLFDCNVMHGSNSNISPFPRVNLFVVYNAVSNRLHAPFCGTEPRPEFVGAREYTPTLTGL